MSDSTGMEVGGRETTKNRNRGADLSRRIFLVSHHWVDPDQGAAGADLRLASALTERGHSVAPFFLDHAFSRVQMGSRWNQLRFPWSVARHGLREHRREAFDVVETTAGDGWILQLAAGSGGRRPLFVARTHGIERKHFELTVQLAEKEGLRLNRRYGWYHGGYRLREVERDLKRADVVVLHSQEDRDYAIDRLRLESRRIRVIPCGISDWFFEDRQEFDPELMNRILFVGTWIRRKGVDLLPRIVSRIGTNFPQIRFTLAGVGVDEEIVLRDFEPGDRHRVKVIPNLPNHQLPRLMSQHGLFLFPSRCEGFGLVLVEAMARGLIVVSANVGVAPEVVVPGKTGYLVEVDDADEYVRRIEEVARSSADLPPIATAAARVAEKFSWKRSAEARDDLYREFTPRTTQEAEG